ncbi:MAG: nucleotidyltransferase substrate binding protein, partial [candidate division WOR-3 bacterium]|nr:nucleotidyltransferase substrate binding protein [candidate division WOR-3 bacterium]
EDTVRCLEMTDRRNDTAHTYKEEIAQIIYSKIKGYCTLMKNLSDQFKDKIE